ncbi:OmpP1/FadL family transporter [Thauera butanivorans]|uniref:OmpP1/FadL family transporter n=1 Tax=Thauera butanivorans TaxID=86174 RepID=UPI000838A6AE|nr:outer membrane protein transport protein [Thauera butanivorans]
MTENQKKAMMGCRAERSSGSATSGAGRLATVIALTCATGVAHALNTGTDMNMSYKPASGGMAGAAYTKPQEPSAAVFGNPATMTQLRGTHFGIGAAFLIPEVDVHQRGAAGSRTSSSDARNYVVPDTAVTHEIGGGWFLGGGIELDAGIGVDFRDDPITVPSVSTDPSVTGLPLLVELISFNANVAAAKQLTPQTAVGAALTIGFGLAQLGTSGPSGSFGGLLGPAGCDPATAGSCGFGGNTSSVHDVGFGASIGLTHRLTSALTLSAALKSPVKYKFKNILYQNAVGTPGYQDLTVEQPLEAIVGMAYDVTPSWMVEADVVWKNWSSAETYEDVYDDQFLVLLGTQYRTGPWSLRLGYSYAQDILRDTPNNTLGNLRGLGPIPLGAAAGSLGTDVVKLVQMSLVPVIWQHTIAAGVGFDLSSNVRLDVFGAYGFKNEDKRTTSIGAALAGPVGPETYEAEVSAWAVGAGVNFSF